MFADSAMRRFLGKNSIVAQRTYRWYLGRRADAQLPYWSHLLTAERELWTRAFEASRTGKRVLIATGTGGQLSAAIFESLLAAALTLRGADVHFMLCDGVLPACQMAEIGLMRATDYATTGAQPYFCRNCFRRSDTLFAPFGLSLHRYSDYVTSEEARQAKEISTTWPLREAQHMVLDGVAVGEHALAGTLRYFARSTLEGEPHAEAVARRHLEAAVLAARATRNLLRLHHIEVVCVSHGVYVPHGLVAEVARAEGRRVVTWNVAYRQRSFIFSHSDTYHRTLLNEPTVEWESIPWTNELERDLLGYLKGREKRGRDWIAFQHYDPEEDSAKISRLLGVDFSHPTITMLTNVAWDAQLHYSGVAFKDMLEWVVKTIGYFADRPALQLIVRVHPAEVSGDIPSRQPVCQEIRRVIPALPRNVVVIPPHSRISTYAVARASNAAIIYATKTGVELACMGIPVVVAGAAWIRGKGVTLDAATPSHYFRILDQLPFSSRMNPAQIARARKYAYHFFFRRMIPVPQTEPTGTWPPYRLNVSSLHELQPGPMAGGLNVICQGILNGTSFVYPADGHPCAPKAQALSSAASTGDGPLQAHPERR